MHGWSFQTLWCDEPHSSRMVQLEVPMPGRRIARYRVYNWLPMKATGAEQVDGVDFRAPSTGGGGRPEPPAPQNKLPTLSFGQAFSRSLEKTILPSSLAPKNKLQTLNLQAWIRAQLSNEAWKTQPSAGAWNASSVWKAHLSKIGRH